jgi:hypothetical protein
VVGLKKDTFEKLWLTEPPAAIATKLNLPLQRVYRAARAFKLPSRSEVLRAQIDEEEKPTQEEIQERSAEVRAKWSDRERRRRYVGGVSWTPRAATTRVR